MTDLDTIAHLAVEHYTEALAAGVDESVAFSDAQDFVGHALRRPILVKIVG